MPELPEVETVVRDLRAAGLPGRLIRTVLVRCPKTVAGLPPNAFTQRLQGRRIRSIRRRAKYIVITLSDGRTLLIHLRMTGQFRFADPQEAHDPHEHVILSFDRGPELRFRDTRKFGRWQLLDDPGGILDRLGPEPLDRRFTRTALESRWTGRGRQLKPLLLDQTFLAGLGNIYADEVLWDARLHPQRRANTLSFKERTALYRAIRRVLQRAIRHRGTSLGVARTNFRSSDGRHGTYQVRLKVFHRTGRPCPRCGVPIRRLVVAQRSTHICPQCQCQRSVPGKRGTRR